MNEKISWVKASGIFLAFIRVLVVVSRGDFGSISIGRFGAPGDVLILVSAVNRAVFSALSRRGLKSHPASLMFYVMAIGWIITSVMFLFTQDVGEISHLTVSGWMAVVFLGIFCSGLACIAWYDALKALTTAQTGVFLYIEPLVAVVVAFFILGEPITPASLIGGAIIPFGVWMVNRI